MNFRTKLESAIERSRSLVCVGLDPIPNRLPANLAGKNDPVLHFNRCVIDATADLVCCYKPNFAFYGALGAGGWDVLRRTIEHVPNNIPVIVDAKVGDIGPSAERYAHMFFAELGADALTVTPYMGADCVAPFLAWEQRMTFLVCLTSNPGAADFEKRDMEGLPLYEQVIHRALKWSVTDNVGLVIGATQPEPFARIRQLAPSWPVLVPGVGVQGGDLGSMVRTGFGVGSGHLLINSSRTILYASHGPDFAAAARSATQCLRDDINRYLRVAGICRKR